MTKLLSRRPSDLLEFPQDSIEDHIAEVIQLRTGGMIRGLRVDVSGGRLTLNGRTNSFYNKQLATHAAMNANTGAKIDNDIVVN